MSNTSIVLDIPSNVFLYECSYSEHYVEELSETYSAAIQTDLAFLSDSLNSLPSIRDDENIECTKETELPWKTIALPEPGTYTIRPTKAVVGSYHLNKVFLCYCFCF